MTDTRHYSRHYYGLDYESPPPVKPLGEVLLEDRLLRTAYYLGKAAVLGAAELRQKMSAKVRSWRRSRAATSMVTAVEDVPAPIASVEVVNTASGVPVVAPPNTVTYPRVINGPVVAREALNYQGRRTATVLPFLSLRPDLITYPQLGQYPDLNMSPAAGPPSGRHANSRPEVITLQYRDPSESFVGAPR